MDVGLFIIGIMLWGMLIGATAQWILRVHKPGSIDWSMAIVAGIAGSFVGGALGSLAHGDGFKIHPSGVIWSLVGALIITALWVALDRPPADSELNDSVK